MISSDEYRLLKRVEEGLPISSLDLRDMQRKHLVTSPLPHPADMKLPPAPYTPRLLPDGKRAMKEYRRNRVKSVFSVFGRITASVWEVFRSIK